MFVFGQKKSRALTALFCLFLSVAYAKDNKNPSGQKPTQEVDTLTQKWPDKTLMQSVFSSFTQLIPYMSSREKFKDKNNQAKILSHMAMISKAFDSANHSSAINDGGFRPTLKIMQEHQKTMSVAFAKGHKDYALSRLRASATLCISCHSQLPKEKGVSFSLMAATVTKRQFANDFEYGEYLFIMRNYNKALITYNNAIDEVLSKAHKAKGSQKEMYKVAGPQTRLISDALKQILIITLKVQNDPKRAKLLLEEIKGKEDLAHFLKEEINGYVKQLDTMGLTPLNSPNNDKELDRWVKANLEKSKSLAPEELDLELLTASGVLQRYLNSHHSSKDASKIFYWLSISERPMMKSYFYNLADIYLKECIERDPKNIFAKKCLDEYKDQLSFGYTGSSGTNIPEDEQKELQRLEKLIN